MENKPVVIEVVCPVCGAKKAHENTGECVKQLKSEITRLKNKVTKTEQTLTKVTQKYNTLVADTKHLQKIRETLKDLAYQMAELTGADELFEDEEYDRW
jgi:archaellum component FlaC